MKRLLVMILVFALCLALPSVQASDLGPTEGTCGTRLTWTIDEEGVLTIAGTGAMSDYSSSGGAPWELRKSAITKVVVGSGATSVGSCAFQGCGNLTEVELPGSVKRIGDYCFTNCDRLTEVVLPEGLYSIGNSAFYGCDNLASVALPEGLTRIESYAFVDCDRLTGIVLPDTVTSLGSYAFHSCDALASVTLSGGLTEIKSNTFTYCGALVSVEIPEGVVSIKNEAFYSCGNLASIALPETLERVEQGAFNRCESLATIAYAGTQAEAEAIQIGTYNTPLTAATWQYGASSDTTEGSCGTNVKWTLRGGKVTITGTGAMNYYQTNRAPWWNGQVTVTALEVGEGVTELSRWAFRNCSSLLTVSLPESLQSVEVSAFEGCGSLTLVSYAGTAEQRQALSIASGNTPLTSALWTCADDPYDGLGPRTGKCGSRLTWVLDGEGVLTIVGTGEMGNYTSGGGAPWELRKSSIVKVVVGSGVTSVGDYAFIKCPNLAEVSLPAGLRRLGVYCLSNCDSLAEITLPEGLYEIGNDAFNDCDGLTAVSLPDSLTSMGSSAFVYCDRLASVRLSEGLAGIPSCAFQGSAITVVTVPEGVTQIGNSAFYSCRQLRELRLPSTLEGIGSSAFNYCESLETILYSGTREDAAAIGIGTNNAPLSAATWRFLPDLTKLTMMWLPARLKDIEAEAFAGLACEAIIIPEGCTNIGSRAFAGCANLVYVRIPASVSSIAEDAFADCPLAEIDWVGH